MSESKDSEKKIKNQLEVLKRIDTYIGTTNTKCTIIMSYCAAATAFIFTLIAKLDPAHASIQLLVAIGICSTFALGLALYCMVQAALTIFPITFSKPGAQNASSLVFFGDIASCSDGNAYSNKINEISEQNFLEDLNGQVYTLASIAKQKFDRIKVATVVLMLHFVCMAGFLMLAVSYFLL